MPINVFGNSPSSLNDGKKSDTCFFVQNLYLKTNYLDSNIEEAINLKNQFRIKSLSCPIQNLDAVCNSDVENRLNDPSILRNISHVDFNDKNLDNVRFIEVISCLLSENILQ